MTLIRIDSVAQGFVGDHNYKRRLHNQYRHNYLTQIRDQIKGITKTISKSNGS